MEAVLDWVVLVMRTVGSPGVGLATALETVFARRGRGAAAAAPGPPQLTPARIQRRAAA
jgi:hypothetical protein